MLIPSLKISTPHISYIFKIDPQNKAFTPHENPHPSLGRNERSIFLSRKRVNDAL